jgi:protein-disulfide isomerase
MNNNIMPEEHNTQETIESVRPIPAASMAPSAPAVSWKQNAGIPVAIVIAAALIASAIIFDGNGGGNKVNIQGSIEDVQNTEQTPEMEVAPVTAADFIRGNPNAPIMIVEYSDFDCPFCKNFHTTMNQIMEKYGSDGKIAWVYRNFPLEQLHPNAPKIAAASYCVGEQGGDEAFWKFSDLVFGERETNAQTDMKRLPAFATQSGVDQSKFELCQNSGKYDEQVAKDIEAALKTGARGTPYSVVIIGDQQGILNGAQPFDVVDQIVKNLIAQVDGNTVAE